MCRVRAQWLWEQGLVSEGAQAAEKALDVARRHDDDDDIVTAYVMLALVFHSSGEWKRGLQLEIEHLGRAADDDPRLSLLFDAHT